ncbi:MAG: LysR family transcriptional regulator [Clostridiales bacterium]|mgnify:CR=1 FL=1|nr:LysR family transcriptional regulator [Clostridiales bacterium]
MTSQQIEYFLTLAKLRSFSKTAQKLFITQPSLSQYIQNMESQLGVKLFDRSVNPIRLTKAGEICLHTCETIKSAEENMTNQLADITELKTGSLKIGATFFYASQMLSKSVSEFCRKHEGISVSIIEDNSKNLLEMVKTGELDLYVGAGSFDTKNLDVEELSTERMYLAVPQSLETPNLSEDKLLTVDDIRKSTMKMLTASMNPLDLKLVKELPFLTTTSMEDKLFEICRDFGFKPKIALSVRTSETLFSFVNQGLGVSLIPDTIAKFGNFLDHPKYYPLEHPLGTTKICLVSRKNSYLSKAALEYPLMLKELVDIGTWRV